ncbi:hypothetical protein Tco_1456564 [Tanacetum coccineum]
MRDIVRSKIERELVRIKIHDENAFWDEIGVNAGVLKLMLLSFNLLLPVLVYAARHSLTAVRHKLMLPGITSYCWVTAMAKTVNGVRQIQALVDKKKVIITEKSVRSNLMLEDAEGTECLPNDVIFEQLTLTGKDSGPTEPIPNVATNEEPTSTLSCDPPQSGEDRLQLAELMTLYTKLQKQVLDLKEAETAQAKEIANDLQSEEVVAKKEVVEKEVSAADPVTTTGEVVTIANVEVTTASAPTTTIDELTLA